MEYDVVGVAAVSGGGLIANRYLPLAAVSTPAFWLPALVTGAFGASGAAGPALSLTTAFALLLLAERMRSRWPGLLVVTGLVLAAWVLRDQNFLLGDSRLWITSAREFGAGVHGSREPLAAFLLGLSVGATESLLAPQTTLQAISLLAGVAVAWVLYAAHKPSLRLETAFLLVFFQPLSFVSYGHVEAYPLFLLVLAATLASLAADWRIRARPGLRSLALLILLCLTHSLGVVAAVVVGAASLPGLPRTRTRVTWGVGAIAVLAVLAYLFRSRIPWYRDTGAGYPTYVADLGNLVLLAALPVLPLLVARGRSLVRSAFDRLLLLMMAAFLAVPLALHLQLGAYRDADVLSGCVVLAAFLHARLPRRPAKGTWITPLSLAVGLPFLMSFLVLGRTPAGAAFLDRRLDAGIESPAWISYGREVLAYYHADGGRYEPAVEEMRRAVETTPRNLRLQGALGELSLAAGDTAAAIEALQRSLESPRRPRSLPLLVELLVRRDRIQEALLLGTRWEEDILQSSQGVAALCVGLIRSGHPERAMELCRRRIEIHPGDAVAWFNRGIAAVQAGESRTAASALAAAADLDPGNDLYLRTFGQVLSSLDPLERDIVLRGIPAPVRRRLGIP